MKVNVFLKRNLYIVNGQVQGVGFRPFVYKLALNLNLTGMVKNASAGVIIEVQGSESSLREFEFALQHKCPPLARIVHLEKKEISLKEDETSFVILKSEAGEGHQVLISPDVCICDDCRREIFDPEDPRYMYPFTNCTNCGPRFTITRSIPYDRDKTSMACFPMCPACQKEYDDPLNRRFHAQPNACPECGPHVWLIDRQGKELYSEKKALEETANLLAQGYIFAIKGLGGFHLACDATNDSAVKQLRQRKNRPAKPLAIMVPDIATVRQIARIDSHEQELLLGREHPIVILKKKTDMASGTLLSVHLAPDTNYIGLMLPYTPLHCILLFLYQKYIGAEKLPALVMTSGNFSSEPISLGNREAVNRLAKIADYFLVHNRDILIRCDDSVVYTGGGKRLFFRRARGYTPSPVFLAYSGDTVLGVGPELKNTICLTKENQAFVSQHIGDLKNLETYEFFLETISHLQKILQVEPEAIVCDLHPDYLSTKYAQEQGLPVYSLQHHFAHIHAVLAENRFTGTCLGLALDGTGYGEDGTLWGGELLLVDNMHLSHARPGSFTPIPLPGGEAAIHEPWRISRSFLYLLEKSRSQVFSGKQWPWMKNFAKADEIVLQMLLKDVNCPKSSSCGRFFDAVAALLGLKLKIDYEGQAAILLEKVQDFSEDNFYQARIEDKNGFLIFDTVEFMAQIIADLEKGLDIGRISRRFHLGLMHGLCEWVKRASILTGIKHVALSGGVMQNLTLHRELPEMLKRQGFKVLVHRQVPPNDACISLGQAVYGMLRRRRGEGLKAKG